MNLFITDDGTSIIYLHSIQLFITKYLPHTVKTREFGYTLIGVFYNAYTYEGVS